METPELDELTFEPTAWDLAMSIWLMVDEGSDRTALDELADAMLVWAEEEKLDELTKDALGQLWEQELEEAIREGFCPRPLRTTTCGSSSVPGCWRKRRCPT
jgi:hypothetical protein